MDKFMNFIERFFGNTTLDAPGFVATVAFIIVLAIIAIWHEDSSSLDMRTLVIDKDTNRVSLHKFGQFIALVVSTIAFFYEMAHGRLSEWLFISYMIAWSGANIAAKWLDAKRIIGANALPPVTPPKPITSRRSRTTTTTDTSKD